MAQHRFTVGARAFIVQVAQDDDLRPMTVTVGIDALNKHLKLASYRRR